MLVSIDVVDKTAELGQATYPGAKLCWYLYTRKHSLNWNWSATSRYDMLWTTYTAAAAKGKR